MELKSFAHPQGKLKRGMSDNDVTVRPFTITTSTFDVKFKENNKNDMFLGPVLFSAHVYGCSQLVANPSLVQE